MMYLKMFIWIWCLYMDNYLKNFYLNQNCVVQFEEIVLWNVHVSILNVFLSINITLCRKYAFMWNYRTLQKMFFVKCLFLTAPRNIFHEMHLHFILSLLLHTFKIWFSCVYLCGFLAKIAHPTWKYFHTSHTFSRGKLIK